MATAPETPAVRKPNRQAVKRRDLREVLWPGSSDIFWNRTNNKGFTTIPRLLPLIMTLIRKLSGKVDPSMVYLELWSRVFDEGIVTIASEKDFAYAAGYEGNRAERTMRERLLKLEELGFIKTKNDGLREYAHILMVNPLRACVELKRSRTDVPDEWWTAFARRAGEVGADVPDLISMQMPDFMLDGASVTLEDAATTPATS